MIDEFRINSENFGINIRYTAVIFWEFRQANHFNYWIDINSDQLTRQIQIFIVLIGTLIKEIKEPLKTLRLDC